MLLTHVEGLSAGALAHHILLIEDDPASAESLKVLLELHGWKAKPNPPICSRWERSAGSCATRNHPTGRITLWCKARNAFGSWSS